MSNMTDAADRVNGDDLYEPSEADLADYQTWCREREDRLMAERVAGPTLVEKLRAAADRYLDEMDDDLHGLGEAIWTMAAEAEALEARSWEQYTDRKAAMIDARSR